MKPLTIALFVFAITFGSTAIAQPVPQHSDPRVAALYALAPEAYQPDEAPYAETWPAIPEADLLFGRRIWRTLDTRTDGNRHLREAAATGGTLASQFISDGMSGKLNIYAGTNQRFTTALKPDSLVRLLDAKQDGVFDKFDAAAATRYLIKEDWLYAAAEKRFVVRIIGIAPLRTVRRPGQPAKDEPVFWVYYPEARKQLRERAMSVRADSRVQNLDQLFELRRFESTVNAAGPFRQR